MGKKTLKNLIIVIINIILFCLFIFTIDFLIYKKFFDEYIIHNQEFYRPPSYTENYRGNFSSNSLAYYIYEIPQTTLFRKPHEQDPNNKNSILFFGCSFAYGQGLTEEKTLSSKIAKATNRYSYNFAQNACGIQHMLFYIQHPRFLEQIKKSPEYAIYLFIPSHLERLQAYIFPHPMQTNGINLKYKIHKNKLKLAQRNFGILEKTFILKSILYQADLKRDNTSPKNKEYNSKLTKKLFIESKNELQKKYPNIKFVILRYETEDDETEKFEKEEMWNDLEENGFKIIKTSDLIGRKFKYASEDTTFDQYHPSEKAFESLVQPLIKELNL